MKRITVQPHGVVHPSYCCVYARGLPANTACAVCGNIFGAASTVPGRAGIGGPYKMYGIVAGANAALSALDRDLPLENRRRFVVGRDQGYIGVLVDDLVTRGTMEPYRMFTSRAEYRLHLRADNADLRLTEKGAEYGLVESGRLDKCLERTKLVEDGVQHLDSLRFAPEAWGAFFLEGAEAERDAKRRPHKTASELLAMPHADFDKLKAFCAEQNVDLNVAADAEDTVAAQCKYAAYLTRQKRDMDNYRKHDATKIPADLDYSEANLPALSAEEREKLDHYLAAFESVRGRNDQLVAMREKIINNAPELTTQYASTVFTDRVSVFFDLASAALITGLTNTISIRADWLSVKYATFGFKNTSVHDIGHQKTTDNGMNREQAREVIRKFQIDQIAKLAEKLKAVPEGDGTMLDNTMIIYFSDTGEAHHSQRKEWPFVVVGGRGQNMKTAGRYLRYPQYGQQGHKTIGNWYNTILQANGGEVMDYFGQTDANLKDLDLRGPLSELAI